MSRHICHACVTPVIVTVTKLVIWPKLKFVIQCFMFLFWCHPWQSSIKCFYHPWCEIEHCKNVCRWSDEFACLTLSLLIQREEREWRLFRSRPSSKKASFFITHHSIIISGFSMFKLTNRLDGCYQRHSRRAVLCTWRWLLMLLESCSMSLSEKWAFSLILIVIETLNGRDGYILG